MDLPYPSYRKSENGEQSVLNCMNKKLRSTIWSMNDLGKHQQNLPQHTRNDLIKSIQKNDVNRLIKQIDKASINYETEIGNKGTKWSFLHFCARWNAVTCLQYILKQKYKISPNQFLFFINSRTSEGYTPLMISVLYQSKAFLEQILDYGGVDIFLVDNNKNTAYQMAITQNNQTAINRLVLYEKQNKITTFLNSYKLAQKFIPPIQEKKCSICKKLWSWIFSDVKNKEIIDDNLASTKRGITKQQFIDSDFPAVASSVCNDVESVTQQNIQWFRLDELFASKPLPLFEKCAPYEIKQLNFAIKHSLSVFQSIIQYPWILRNRIRKQNKTGMYTCLLFLNGIQQEVVIDDLIPCLKSTREPMFFSSNKQLWPMLLQKAWVKAHGNYTLSRDVSPKIIFQQLLGFHSQTFKILNYKDVLFNQFKLIHKKGYLIVLTAKQQSSLKEDDFGPESFGIFSLTQKDGKQYCLVNCPFIIPQWKQKQKSEALSLRLIRSHYNSTSQMAVWMDTEQIMTNFASFTVCYGDSSLNRTQLKIKVKQCIFLKYQCQQNITKQKFTFKIHRAKGEAQQIPIKSIEISKDDKIDDNHILPHQQSFNTIKAIEISQGNFLSKIQLEQTDINIVLVGYSQYKIHIQIFDEEFGKIEWLYLLRDQIAQKLEESNQPTYETLYDYILIVQKSQNSSSVSIPYDFQNTQCVVQGFRSTDSIALQKCETCWYGILKLKYIPEKDEKSSKITRSS